jgi:c-di-GMP-binding flagellar brake protein YcgR
MHMSTSDQMVDFKPNAFCDRRKHTRMDLEIAVKLRRSANATYSCGRTLDVSAGGAGIELIGPREAHEGERIAIAFENLRCPVTRAARMIGAQIVRVEPMHDGRQLVAIRFDALQGGLERLQLPQAA